MLIKCAEQQKSRSYNCRLCTKKIQDSSGDVSIDTQTVDVTVCSSPYPTSWARVWRRWPCDRWVALDIWWTTNTAIARIQKPIMRAVVLVIVILI